MAENEQTSDPLAAAASDATAGDDTTPWNAEDALPDTARDPSLGRPTRETRKGSYVA